MRITPRARVLVGVAALVAACSDDTSSQSGTGDTTSASTVTAADDAPAPTTDSTGAGTVDPSADDSSSSPVADDTGSSDYVCATPPTCGEAGAGPTKVELRVFGIDDEIVVHVNGMRRGFWSIPSLPGVDTGRIDITHWFARGHNELRAIAANTGGPGSSNVQVWVDDALVLDSSCADSTCPPGVEIPLGYFHDVAVSIDSDAFPCAQQLCVHGGEEGSLYLDGVYTGARAPIEVVLPPGEYRVGVGSGTDDPTPETADGFVHEGRFRQRTTTLMDAPSEVVLSDADLVSPQGYRFLIVPIRNVQYPNGEMGVLADEVPTVLADAVELASNDIAGPFAYGMVEFFADVHPMLETTVTADADGFVAIDQTALGAAGLDAAAVADHDVVVWAYSSHLADGTPVTTPPCCAWGGGSQIWMHTGWVYEPPIVYYVLVHEWLHTTEDELILLGYSGADGVHGADEHGYASGSNGEFDFGQFYRHFMRGQVAENGTWVGAVNQLWQLPQASRRRPRFDAPIRALPFGR